MCHETTGANHDRPLFAADVPLIASHFPALNGAGVQAVYQAISDHHWPQPAVLVAVLEMIDRSIRRDVGYYSHPTMPFSAMDLETYDRVQSDEMYAFHAVFESMALAQRNMKLLDEALTEHFGLRLVLFCDCGCSIVPADSHPYESDWYQQINELRSLAEAAGTPVVRVTDFIDSEWTRRQAMHGLDMGPSETASYTKMYNILLSLPSRQFDIKRLASQRFAQLFAEPV